MSSSGARLGDLTLDLGSGRLQPLDAALSIDPDPRAITLDAGGRFAYVASYASATISVFAVDPETGRLTRDPERPIGIPPRPRALATTHLRPSARERATGGQDGW